MCQICRLSVRNRISAASVPAADAMSLNSITSLRFQRSTRVPAMGVNKTVGRNAKKLMVESAVICPVFCQAQMVNANQVIALPRSETTCPSQRTVKARMPVG